ncbi:MAG: hypothetical protein ACKOGL_14635, partial [Acidimicrobiaceae bacterium]
DWFAARRVGVGWMRMCARICLKVARGEVEFRAVANRSSCWPTMIASAEVILANRGDRRN